MNSKNNLKTTFFLLALLYTAALIIDVTVENTMRSNFKAEQTTKVTASLNEVSKAIQGKIEQNLNLISGVPAYLSTKDTVSKNEFYTIAENIFHLPNMLRSMALTDGYVVKYIYPESANQKLIGVDLSKVPGQRDLAVKAAMTRGLVADGPIFLVQGRYGIIGRQAIYRNNHFDSMISSVIDMSKVQKFAEDTANRYNLKICFRKKHSPIMFFGERELFNRDSKAIIVPVNIMNMQWELAGLPSQGFKSEFPYENYVHLYIFLFIFMSTVLILYKHFKVRENINLNSMLRMAQSVGQMGSFICFSNKNEILMSEEAFRICRNKFKRSITINDFLMMIDDSDREKVLTALMPSETIPNKKTEITFKIMNAEIYVRLTAVPMYNIHNERSGIEGVLTDITQQKTILKELAESEARFRDLVLCTSDMVWEMDTNCRYTYFTGQAKEIYGYNEQDMIGKAPVFIDETNIDKTSVFFCGTIVKNGLPLKDMERWVKDVNGNERCFLINGVPFYDSDGKLKGYRGVDKDITEQFKLKTEREMIFRVSRDGIAIIDRKTRFKDCNQAYLNITGYSYNEILTKSCYEMTPEEERDKSQAMMAELIKTGYYDKFEKTCLTKNGKRLTIQMTLSVLSDNRILIAARDISDIKEYQRKIEQSEKQLKSVFDVSPIPLCMLDRDNTPLLLNKTFEETFGYNLDNIKSLDDWWRKAYPDKLYREKVKSGWTEYVERIINGEEQEPVQAIVRCNDGSNKDIVFLFAPLDGGSIIAAYDITARVEIEKKLQEYISIVDKNVSISRSNDEGVITSVSEAFARLCGYTKQELIGRKHEILHHPDMDRSIYENLVFTLMSGKSWHGELHKINKDGSPFWTETLIYPMVNDIGNREGFIAIDQDITDKKRIEELSVKDKLTGIYNRIKLDEVLHTEFLRYSRSKTPFSVIMFDIDFFKKVNDTYGHLVGDEVLKKMSWLVGSSVRENDIFGRWGGEEFLIICPDTDAKGASTLAEKLRRKIELYEFPEVERVTCSFGVAEIESLGADNIVKNADDALYRSKQTGRNKVETHKL